MATEYWPTNLVWPILLTNWVPVSLTWPEPSCTSKQLKPMDTPVGTVTDTGEFEENTKTLPLSDCKILYEEAVMVELYADYLVTLLSPKSWSYAPP